MLFLCHLAPASSLCSMWVSPSVLIFWIMPCFILILLGVCPGRTLSLIVKVTVTAGAIIDASGVQRDLGRCGFFCGVGLRARLQ